MCLDCNEELLCVLESLLLKNNTLGIYLSHRNVILLSKTFSVLGCKKVRFFIMALKMKIEGLYRKRYDM